MQDISRDDFSLLNGSETITAANHQIDKDMCPTLISRIQNTSPINPNALLLSKHLTTPDDNAETASSAYASVKLEDTNTIDLFPTHPTSWQEHPMNSHELAHHRLSVHHHHRHEHNNNSKLLLQGSDDPLISHGANSVLSHDDDHPECLLTAADNQQSVTSTIQEHANYSPNARTVSNNPQPSQENPPQRTVKSGCSSLTKQQLKVKANLMSARNQLQQQQQLQQQRESSTSVSTIPAAVPNQNIGQRQRSTPVKTKTKKPNNSIKLRFHHQALPPEYLSHYEATQGQTRPTKAPKSTNNQQRQNSKQSRNSSQENVRSWLQKIAEIQRTANASKADERQANQTSATQQPLDTNNNPQHQRSLPQIPAALTPATIIRSGDVGILKSASKEQSHKRSHFYSDLPYMGEITLDNSKPRRGRKPKKADICHLIYKNYGTVFPKKRPESQDCINVDKVDLKYRLDSAILMENEHEQPLNLCMRDQPADSYSISSADVSETNSSCASTPPVTPSDFDRDSMLANNLKNSLTNLNELDSESNIKREKETSLTPLPAQKSSSTKEESVLNPLTIYYQKLLESGVLLHNANGPIKTIQKDNQLALKIPIPSGLFLPPKQEKTQVAAASPVSLNVNSLNLEYPEQLSTPSSIKSENSTATNASSSTIMGTPCSQQQQAPQKRKRSAIFIPPMNVENASNPATEVSICKFKFTGGSKPTLQEKKMLSVDAGGNYRYFRDKTRGYEYFPREMLQNAGLVPGVNHGQKLLLIDIPPPSAGLSNELLQIPESPTSSMLMATTTTATTPNGNVVDTSITSKTPPPPRVSPSSAPSSFVDISHLSEVNPDHYFEENLEYNQTSSSPSNANRFMLARKKQALHQLRKTTQREKLEKTFKEQGFLIQTQHLESAEGATYCKFRQLKKFTRYLFRNWKDYLPDELQRNTASDAATIEEFGQCPEQKDEILTTMPSGSNVENRSILENVRPGMREDHI